MNSERNKSVLVAGCGWVGKKLGQHLADKGFTVYGTTRTEANFADLKDHHIIPVQLELPADNLTNIELPEADSVVISISPGRGDDRSFYPNSIHQLAKLWKDANTQVIMYSSTSAYGNKTGTLSEHDAHPDPENENIMLAAEGELQTILNDSVVLRLSGLYGEDRHPVKYLAGRKDIKDGDAPVNLVHRDDVIQATELMITNDVRSEIFNICSPIHPDKKILYTTIAERLGKEVPSFLQGGKDNKSISSDKIMRQIGFTFLHPDPLEYAN